jgi:Protein of unknown function (DUF2782)
MHRLKYDHPYSTLQIMATTLMRLLSLLLLSGIYVVAFAAKPVPGKTEPPPPPTASGGFTDEEPEVTIIKKKDQTVEEYRLGGRLYMIKIIPKVGKPYYLVDDRGDGKFSRQESLDSGLRPPRWVIHRF